MKLSVVLCTHSPRRDYLVRMIDGLRAQSLPASRWEFLVVDNRSPEPVRDFCLIDWHPEARIVTEPELGLTAARLRGIAEARGDVLVWVDDDNILAPDYLATVNRLAREWPQLGAWGCGDFTPEWETPPAPELAPCLEYLAVGRAPRDRWSNQRHDFAATPAGAGMCVRRPVAQEYAANVRRDGRRKALGRTGSGLGACEDHDLAFTAIDLGLGTGVFTSLRLTHLMPAARVTESYLLRLIEGHARSTVILMAMRDATLKPPRASWIDSIRRWRLHRAQTPMEQKIHQARERGASLAWRILAQAPIPPATATSPSSTVAS